ncbi:MAG: hypothetical protein JEZ06_16075 [Anaerolineaceae bacterium]|nr:hypothetical protein [Anaerolineaceae bacterium]
MDDEYPDEEAYLEEGEDWEEDEWIEDEWVEGEESGIIEDLVGFLFYDEPEDCYEDEIYDEVDHLCYLAEENMDGWLEDYLPEIFEDKPFAGSEDYAEINENILITYSVEGNNLISPELSTDVPQELTKYQNETEMHQKAWSYFTILIPMQNRSWITHYVIFTDGKEETMAWVEPENENLQTWQLGLDIVDAENPTELTYTLIHEFGHLLTLNPTQIDPDANACSFYQVQEGCSHENSYLNDFYAAFWTSIYDEWDDIQYEEDDEVFYERLDAFYYKYEDQFVTDYAATNPEEDIAEAWTHFVLKEKPDGNTIAEEKVLFFYNYPELISLRGEIATRTASRLRRK